MRLELERMIKSRGKKVHMGTKWTKEQQEVIRERGKNLLVSAAAGSGKTAVLVERILSEVTDPEHPTDIDRLLVVTFTNSAAAEMKERISAAISARLAEHPEDENLQRQSVLLPGARISTIHGFCSFVIRNYFHLVDVDPAYRIADEGELRLMRADVMEELLEKEYQNVEENPAFQNFVEAFALGKNDSALEKLIEGVYQFAASSPDPEQWLMDCLRSYSVTTTEECEQLPWIKETVQRARSIAKDAFRRMEKAQKLADEAGIPKIAEFLCSEMEVFQQLAECDRVDAFYEQFRDLKFKDMRYSKKEADRISKEDKGEIAALRQWAKNAINKLKKDCFSKNMEELLAELAQIRPLAEELIALTGAFARGYAEKKRASGVVDFNDLEHLALRILYTKTEDGLVKSDAAKELSERFSEVICDEYQDSNLIQELILEAVAGTHRKQYNRFMVGDMKQSIYAFRMARPELFLEKYKTYVPYKEEEEEETRSAAPGVRITLGRNFRSRSEVLDPVNAICRRIMCGVPGGIVYDDDATLHLGASYPEVPKGWSDKAELLLLNSKAEAFQKGKGKEAVLEAEAMIAVNQIREIKEKGYTFDRESGTMRRASYRDIVILLRNAKTVDSVYERVLTGAGIPVRTTANQGYFSALEVITVLNYLRILDNPRQDVPMASVLHSPIGALTSRELAVIRSLHQDGTYFEAVQSLLDQIQGETEGLWQEAARKAGLSEADCASLAQKMKRFDETYRRLRNMVPCRSVHELLQEILDQTGYGAFAAAMPAGAQREANLKMLVAKASEYEKTSYHGLFHFIRYMEKLEKYEVDFGEANPEDESGDTVRIMTIHKSKGLEFPYVILAGTGRNFNKNDEEGAVVLHVDEGIGIDRINPDDRTRESSFIKNAVSNKIKEDRRGEEMRVLYVAMTRAKEKLIITGAMGFDDKNPFEGYVEERGGTEPLSYTRRVGATCYLDWILAAMPDESLMHTVLLDPEEIGEANQEHTKTGRERIERLLRAVKEPGAAQADPAIRDFLAKRMAFSYPYETSADLPAKFTVSELKSRIPGLPEEEDGREMFEEERIVPLIPEFMRKKQLKESVSEQAAETPNEGGGAIRGTIYHKVFRSLRLDGEATPEGVAAQLSQMTERGILTAEEASVVAPEEIAAFLRSPLAGRMLRAQSAHTLRKEQPFVIDIPADEIDPSFGSSEPILVQGVIDVCFKENGKYVILDYKTDRISRNRADELIQRYRTQFFYYKKALEQILQVEVGEMILYSVALQKELTVV
jgi:ATP-dependent helicase/nuclease subunit A